VVAAANPSAALLAVAAIVSAVGGIITAVAAVIRARRETQDDCDKLLEDANRRLHRYRMAHPEDEDDGS